MIEVIKPGLLDMVVDLGRPGLRALGVPAGGAADAVALARANRCLSNADAAAGLELTLFGPVLRFVTGGRIVLAGAHMPVWVDGEKADFDSEINLPPGAILQFGRAISGLRSWLAVAGGVEVPLVMGGRSTFLPGGFGGYSGRALRAGDVLAVGEPVVREGDVLPRKSLLRQQSHCLRIVPGPQIEGFSDRALAALGGQAGYRVLVDSNRVGIRLAGAKLVFCGDELPSQGVLPGAIQVPPDGQPIVLGWDGPVTGGYPVIAGVIAADLWKLAQCSPGDVLHFEFVGRAEALAAWQDEIGLWS